MLHTAYDITKGICGIAFRKLVEYGVQVFLLGGYVALKRAFGASDLIGKGLRRTLGWTANAKLVLLGSPCRHHSLMATSLGWPAHSRMAPPSCSPSQAIMHPVRKTYLGQVPVDPATDQVNGKMYYLL